MPPNCAFCAREIVPANDSDEHIIPNAIGGRRKVRTFICKECNSKKGETWDAELARQFNGLSVLLDISRQRGEPPGEKVKTGHGENYILKAGGGAAPAKASYQEIDLGNGARQISILVRSKDELKRMLPGIKAKYPSIDADKILQDATMQSKYMHDYFISELKFDGQKAGRSVVKSALALACEAGIPASACEQALAYMNYEAGEFCWDFCHGTDLLKNRPIGTALHCVAVQGYESGALVAYVEYFGADRMLIQLSANYRGPLVKRVYALDPVSGVELTLDLEDIPKTPPPRLDIAEEARRRRDALDAIIGPAMERAKQKEMCRVVDQAIRAGLANCGGTPGKVFSPEVAWRFSALVVENMRPWIEHQLFNPFASGRFPPAIPPPDAGIN